MPDIASHCSEIERCNQRGGRMLSIVDLIEAETFSRNMAAYALAAIGKGSSFMTGALPGGAGKTTIMGALLNMVPDDVRLEAADVMNIDKGMDLHACSRRCYICHEIGSGDYYAYLWGEPLRRYFTMPEKGYMLATNLHADTYEQAREQICSDNSIPEQHFRRMNLIFFLNMKRGLPSIRRIDSIWESNGKDKHKRIFQNRPADIQFNNSAIISPKELENAKEMINNLLDSGARTIEDVRGAIIRMRTC